MGILSSRCFEDIDCSLICHHNWWGEVQANQLIGYSKRKVVVITTIDCGWLGGKNQVLQCQTHNQTPSHKSCSGAVTPLSLIRLRLWDAVVIICTALSDQFSAKHKKFSRSSSLMDTDGETVALMLLEGQGTQTLHRYLSCCAMTLNHFWGGSLQACIIIFLRASFHQSFRNWPN